MHNVINEISLEYQDQRRRFSKLQDDCYILGQLAGVAACYCLDSCRPSGTNIKNDIKLIIPRIWPWDIAWWKPRTQRENLIRAAALIISEIERLDRAAQR